MCVGVCMWGECVGVLVGVCRCVGVCVGVCEHLCGCCVKLGGCMELYIATLQICEIDSLN